MEDAAVSFFFRTRKNGILKNYLYSIYVGGVHDNAHTMAYASAQIMRVFAIRE